MEGIAPTNAYLCTDGASIIVAGNGDAIFQRYMETIGRPDLAADPALQTNAGRWGRREELDAAIGEWTIQHDRDDALKLLDAAGVPSGPIYTAADICADEQYAARNMIQKFDVSTGEAEPQTVGFPGIVPVIGGSHCPSETSGPTSANTPDEVLSSLLGPAATTRSEHWHDTSSQFTPRAELRDVTLRDGLQLTGKILPTERKVEIVRELLALGVPALELGSMARPDLVPPWPTPWRWSPRSTPEELEKCWIWVATPRHVAKAAAAGARNFQYCLSASDSHNKANIGRTTEDSLAAMPEAVGYARRSAERSSCASRPRSPAPSKG